MLMVDKSVFIGTGKPVTIHDIQQAADELKVGVAELRAILSVESRNKGFDVSGQPIILFEPHVLYRNLKDPQQLQAAVDAGIAYPHWGMKPYPKGNDAQYQRLARAISINEEAAFRAISMGMGQILGENYKHCGFDSARALFEDCKAGEPQQLEQIVAFIKYHNINLYMRRHDWRTVAALYNGTGQIDKYAAWLKEAYEKWSKVVNKPRSELTVQDLRSVGSSTIAKTDSAKNTVATAAVTGVGGGAAILDTISKAAEPMNTAVEHAKEIKGTTDWLTDNWQFVLGAAGVVIFGLAVWRIWKLLDEVQQQRVQNARDGINIRI